MTTGNPLLLNDEAAMSILGLSRDAADDVAAMAPHAVAKPGPPRLWHRAKVVRWAHVIGAVSLGFSPRKSSGARG